MAPLAAMAAGALLALARHVRPRLVRGEEPPAAAVAERLVQLAAAQLRELGRRLQERRAALAAGELLALARHLRPRLLPSEEPPAPAVAERIVRMSAEELGEVGQRVREQ